MNEIGTPALLAILAGVIIVTLGAVAYAYTSSPLKGRERLAKSLGKGFVILIALGVLAGMVQPFLR